MDESGIDDCKIIIKIRREYKIHMDNITDEAKIQEAYEKLVCDITLPEPEKKVRLTEMTTAGG
ncbi:MAG TPA: hypothetical protein GX736_02750 [Mogibacterium sp.]|nr:hypothetical protein [Mogibacterium sp.]